jgi:hypothetical protein
MCAIALFLPSSPIPNSTAPPVNIPHSQAPMAIAGGGGGGDAVLLRHRSHAGRRGAGGQHRRLLLPPHVRHPLLPLGAAAFDNMSRYSLKPDVVTLNSLLSAMCCTEGRAQDAQDMFECTKTIVAPDADT